MTKDIIWVVFASIGVMAVWFLVGVTVLNILLNKEKAKSDKRQSVATWQAFLLVGPIGWVFYWLVDEIQIELGGSENE